MKWRFESVSFLLFAVVFSTASSSPSGQKDSLDIAKPETEEKNDPALDDDDLLSRAKKSSPTTTFCVEIKPGNDQPAVVVCDPSKTDQQVPIPSQPHPPAPQYEPPASLPIIPSIIPDYNIPAEYNTRGLQPEASYEPLIFVPQQPQIYSPYQPQILQPISPQPQIIVLRDPSCPSSNPSIYSNPSATRLYSRASQYGIEPMDYAKNGLYYQDEEMMRSIPGANFGGSSMLSNGYTSPLDLIYAKRGPTANSVTLAGGQALVNGNQNFDGQYNRPVLIQCNPKVIPVSPETYAAAVAGKSNEQMMDLKTRNGPIQDGKQTQFMYPGSSGHHGGHGVNHEGTAHYQKGLQPFQQHSVHHYQSNTHPYNQGWNDNAHYKMMSGFGAGERAAEGAGEQGVKNGKGMPVQQGQSMSAESYAKNLEGQKAQGETQHSSQSSFNGQGNRQGVFSSDEQQQKIRTGKLMEGSQTPGAQFNSASFGQASNGFAVPSSKDQGLQKQILFSQNQNQNQQQMSPNAPRNPGFEQKNSQQSGGGDMSYSQMLLQRMKSSVGQGNLVQPYMIPSSGSSTGNKQIMSKA